MADLRMPTLGADMTSGRLLTWHVAPGDVIRRGDIVATVDTDKAEIDIETFDDGIVDELVVAPGAKVPVGAVLATLRPAGATGCAASAPPPAAAGPTAPSPRPSPPAPPGPTAPSPPAAATRGPAVAPSPRGATEGPAVVHRSFVPVVAPHDGHRRRVSPLARRRAAELGVDLANLVGSGPGGAVVRADVEAVARPAAPAGPAVARRADAERRATLLAAVGRLMERSKREIPHYGLQRTIDLEPALRGLETANAALPPAERVLPAALLLHAAVQAAAAVPEVNGTFEDGAFHAADHVHLGVAIALRGGGVLAPTIPAADALTLPELMSALRGLTARARNLALRGRDLTPATFTVTSLGDRGADLVHGVIFPPQVALAGFGRIAPRPFAIDGLVGARRTVIATLAGDHRVSDGQHGSAFLDHLDRLLQEPHPP